MIGQVKDIIEDDDMARAVIEIRLDDARRLWEKMEEDVVISWVN
jgi:hypothetical protein